MALLDAARHLAEHRGGASAARGAAHERDDAEAARERAAVLDLDERADAVEPVVGLDAAERPELAGEEAGRLLGAAGDDGDVRGQGSRRAGGEVRRRSRSERPGVWLRAARAAALRLFASASFVTQQPLTIATSAPVAASRWPSASRRSRI